MYEIDYNNIGINKVIVTWKNKINVFYTFIN